MALVGKRWLACIALAGLVPFSHVAHASIPATAFLVAQAAPPATVAPVTYTPIRRPGTAPATTATKPAVVPGPAPPPVQYKPTPPPAPFYPPTQWTQPAMPPTPAPAPRADVPYPTPPALSSPSPRAGDPAAVVTAHALSPSKPSRHYVGIGTDVGMPDGLTLGLVLMPADWLRISAALGTTSFSEPELVGLYRGSLSFVPLGWGPSFSFDAGHRNVAPTTWILRTFFSVPSWVNPYVQELGYTFFNAHIGFDYTVWGFTLYLHGGGTYLLGTIHAPKSVVVDSKTNTSINIAQDGEFSAFTLSAKAGIIYHFGGGG